MARSLVIAGLFVLVGLCGGLSPDPSPSFALAIAVNNVPSEKQQPLSLSEGAAAPPSRKTSGANGGPSPSSSSNAASSSSSSSDTPFAFRSFGDLPSLNINASTLTLSGISAGGAMAVQFQIAFSRIVKGVGTIAAVPYMCAQVGGAITALNCMSKPYQIEADDLMAYISTYAAAGLIDDPSYLKGHMSMVFSGASDSVVLQGTVRVVDQMYARLGVRSRYQSYNISAEHAWVTHTYGKHCGYLGEPYINNCDHDFGGEFLTKAFAAIGHAAPLAPRGPASRSNLFKFSQATYGASPLVSMDTIGFVYVPTACQSGLGEKCHLHVNFHGCGQQRSAFSLLEEDMYVSNTGLNEWAEANNIVVLYPQTVAALVPANPKGCFDWWGYTNLLFAQKGGVQMHIVREMIRSIGGF